MINIFHMVKTNSSPEEIGSIIGELVYPFYQKLEEVDLEELEPIILEIANLVRFPSEVVSKHFRYAHEPVYLDSVVTSLQLKVFNTFIRALARKDIKQCYIGLCDYLQQVYRDKKNMTKLEIIHINSMVSGLEILIECQKGEAS